jgi:hypothetical protein
MMKSGTASWPSVLPSPESEGDHIKLANELFLCALAWSIHHELAHITLQHELIVSSDVAIKQEKAADLEATRWVLDDLKSDDLRLTKRALGVATGVLALQSLEVESKIEGLKTHPPAQERVHYCLTRYELDNEQLVLAYTAVGLQVLFSGRGISPNIDGTSPAEILSGLLVDISRASHG